MDIRTETNNEFKRELKALLEKYNASIEMNIDGDTHCITTEMKVLICNEVIVSTNDLEITHHDIEL